MSKIILLFLDIDGVLNNHRPTESGYNNICENNCRILNYVLRAYPNLKIVISSAWRYMILDGEMTLKGFEYMLLKSGLLCKDRVIGCTGPDPIQPNNHFDDEQWTNLAKENRANQIREYLNNCGNPPYIVIDDLNLDIDNFVRTDCKTGLVLTDYDPIIKVIARQVGHDV